MPAERLQVAVTEPVALVCRDRDIAAPRAAAAEGQACGRCVSYVSRLQLPGALAAPRAGGAGVELRLLTVAAPRRAQPVVSGREATRRSGPTLSGRLAAGMGRG